MLGTMDSALLLAFTVLGIADTLWLLLPLAVPALAKRAVNLLACLTVPLLRHTHDWVLVGLAAFGLTVVVTVALSRTAANASAPPRGRVIRVPDLP